MSNNGSELPSSPDSGQAEDGDEAESESSSDEEVKGMILPSLIRHIKAILDQYPDDGQILKELIQNAEDAGARKVKVIHDQRSFTLDWPQTSGKRKTCQSPIKSPLQGPSLCVYNDALFTDRDWEGVTMLQCSIKEQDKVKVGRFGLGFKSVFHLTAQRDAIGASALREVSPLTLHEETGLPVQEDAWHGHEKLEEDIGDSVCVVSGRRILFMKPLERDQNATCHFLKLAKLRPPLDQDVLQALGGLCGFSRDTLREGFFPGTLFWLPLRREASELSDNLYTESKVVDLFQSFQAEASTVLLFLKSIESVELYVRSPSQEASSVAMETEMALLSSVALTEDCVETVRAERKTFMERIACLGGELSPEPIQSFVEMTIQLKNVWNSSGEEESCTRQSWLVAAHYSGRDVSESLQKLCRDESLSYSPLMGLAAPLWTAEDFQGRAFCFLPLPQQRENTTGLPVHVNGFLALSQNRRHIKWPSADQSDAAKLTDKSLLWNLALVREILSRLYAALVERLVVRGGNSATRGDNCALVYQSLPDEDKVFAEWRPFLSGLHALLTEVAWAYSRQGGGRWLLPGDAVLATPMTGMEAEVRDSALRVVVETLLQLGVLVVEAPQHVHFMLRRCSCSTEITAELLGRLLQEHGVPDSCDAEARLLLLEFLLTSSGPSHLQGLPLLPTADGGFQPFLELSDADSVVLLSRCTDLPGLLPGLERLVLAPGLRSALQTALEELAQQVTTAIVTLPPGHHPQHEDLVPVGTGSYQLTVYRSADHLPVMLRKMYASRPPPPRSLAWLRSVWLEINREDGPGLHSLADLPLVPEVPDQSSNEAEAVHALAEPLLCRSVMGLSLEEPLCAALTHLGITVLAWLPDFIVSNVGVLGCFVQNPSHVGAMACLRSLLRRDAVSPVTKFNSRAADDEKDALVRLLSECSDLSDIAESVGSLEVFRDTLGRPCCLNDTSRLAPTLSIPFSLPEVLIDCGGDAERRQLALDLGAEEVTVEEIVLQVLCSLQTTGSPHENDRVTVMKFVMQFCLNNDRIRPKAMSTPFLRSSPSSQLSTANSLFDPECEPVRRLFEQEEKFPVEEDLQCLDGLRRLGLKGENDVTDYDILSTARVIEDLHHSGQADIAMRKASQMVKFLTDKSREQELLQSDVLPELRAVTCWPCLQSRPDGYPAAVPFFAAERSVSLEKPVLVSNCPAVLIGSAMPVTECEVAEPLASTLGLCSQPLGDVVVQHLEKAIAAYDPLCHSQFMTIEETAFEYLSKMPSGDIPRALASMPVIFTESDHFQRPEDVWIEKKQNDLQLSPFKFALPASLQRFKRLFLTIGAQPYQTPPMLEEVLTRIQRRHHDASPEAISRVDVDRDFELVVQILKRLSQEDGVSSGSVLVPVHVADDARLELRPASDCTVCDASWLRSDHETAGACDGEAGEGGVVYVHRDLPERLAVRLGVATLTERCMADVEDLDVAYGQEEPLTRRLSTLLKDYTDGLAVPKELVQNADDAGARVVKFLYDQRQGLDARSFLVDPAFAECQGPALWAFNDALFTEEDFRNITKLNGATKESCTVKIGRFGLGFNAVYNLTDVPSFASDNTFATFDPHQRYLGRKRPGMKIDLKRAKNREMIRKMKGQLKPFQNVFGCNLDSEQVVKGTLFRLPLRTRTQAIQSEIKAMPYTKEEMVELLNMLLSKAGSFLLFTENVSRIEVYFLSENSNDPSSQAELLGCFSRKVLERTISTTPLRHFDQCWKADKGSAEAGHTHSVMSKVRIEEEVNANVKHLSDRMAERQLSTTWQVSWALGAGQSAELCRSGRIPGLLPVGTAAVVLQQGTGPLQARATEGFLYCFLPLPIASQLPLHLNAAFAVMPNRRQLCSRTMDDKASVESDWNAALVADPVCQAYLRLLETLSGTVEAEREGYYQLWPQTSPVLPDLARHFYAAVVESDWKVLLYEGRQTSFQKAVFLDRLIQNEHGIRKKIISAMIQFLNPTVSVVVDLPDAIFTSLRQLGHDESLSRRTMDLERFFQDVFLPNLGNAYWSPADRNDILLYGLQHGSAELCQATAQYACIPSTPNGTLKLPRDLVHPDRNAAKLFETEEERFPDHPFRDHWVLQKLQTLGMVTDGVSSDALVERLESVQVLAFSDVGKAINRCQNILKYLTHVECAGDGKICLFEKFQQEEKTRLTPVAFLPVLKTPSDWPCTWRGGTEDSFAKPADLFRQNRSDLVGSQELVLDESSLQSSGNPHISRCLQWLGVKVSVPLETAIRQLLEVTAAQSLQDTQLQCQDRCCEALYALLEQCCKGRNNTDASEVLSSSLGGKAVLRHGQVFLRPDQMVMNLNPDCAPYLHQVELTRGRKYGHFLWAVGVQEVCSEGQLVEVMKDIQRRWTDSVLPEEEIRCYMNLAINLVSLNRTGTYGRTAGVFLPDQSGRLQPTSSLCFDSAEDTRIPNLASMCFVHDTVSRRVAEALGVQSKKRHHAGSLVQILPFGQKEPLSTRLQRILSGYPCDESILKELLQNADDAGATEVRLIGDFRQHPCGTLMDESYAPLQGPALCVYNDSHFTEEDLRGIQDLGVGSKSRDLGKAGQYGVGFNAVYHLTDAPSFLTAGPEHPKRLCILDPTCSYVPQANPCSPGVLIQNVEEAKAVYPNQFNCYLERELNMTNRGTVFRLPLRSASMARKSVISKEHFDETRLRSLLDKFKEDASRCLLFLRNVKKVGIYFVSQAGALKRDFEVNVHASGDDTAENFSSFLRRVSVTANERQGGLHAMGTYEAVSHLFVQDTERRCEEWLVVHRAGLGPDIPESVAEAWRAGDLNALPCGGVAVPLGYFEDALFKKYQAFCVLPLPITTGLPVHVNGHFFLDHEARRNLWKGTSDYRTHWNDLIATKIIAPAYHRALEAVRDRWFESELDQWQLTRKLHQYHGFFPKVTSTEGTFWRNLAIELFREIGRHHSQLFPVLNNRKLELVTAVPERGYGGFFNALRDYYQKEISEPFPEGSDNAVSMADLLKRLGMKIMQAPQSICVAFEEAGVQTRSVSPESVIDFLKSYTTDDPGRFCVPLLPLPLKQTVLKTINVVQRIFAFCKKSRSMSKELPKLPLLVLQNGQLHTYGQCQVIVSEYCDLLPESAARFLHRDLLHLVRDFVGQGASSLQTLDTRTFARLLPATLKDSRWHQDGVDWEQKHAGPGGKKWIKRFWAYLEDHVEEVRLPDQKESFERDLAPVQDWSLLPAVTPFKSHVLYTLKSAWRVLHTEGMPSREQPIHRILHELPLPRLNILALPMRCTLAEKVVSSMDNPFGLLRAMQDIDCTGISFDEASSLLRYFLENIPTLRRSVDDKELKELLSNLRLYTTLAGSLTELSQHRRTLCVTGTVPGEGLNDWARALKCTVLQSKYVPGELLKFLQVKVMGVHEFYAEYLMPNFNIVPSSSHMLHLQFIKNTLLARGRGASFTDEQQRIIDVLAKVKFVPDDSGVVHQASKYFDPREEVFKAMCEPRQLRPEPFCDAEWLDFMALAEMQTKVPIQLFIDFAKQLEANQSLANEAREHKSRVLVEHLFGRNNLLTEGLLPKVRDVRFVVPYNLRRQTESQPLLSIHDQHPLSSSLVSFAESVSFRHRLLVWTSCPMVDETCDPGTYLSHGVLSKVMQQLEMPEVPTQIIVIQHAKNVCQRLTTFTKERMKAVESSIEAVMEALYGHFSRQGDGIKQLQGTPIIFVSCQTTLARPDDVIIDLREDEMIKKYLYKADHKYGPFFPLFKKLGVSDVITANHYVRILGKVKQVAQENELHPEELRVVSIAISLLFRCLKSKEEKVRRVSEEVYIPNAECVLQPSRELILANNKGFEDRCKNANIPFFLGFKNLEIKGVANPEAELHNLPREHRPKLLTDVVQERVQEDCLQRATEGDTSMPYSRLIQHEEFHQGVVRIVHHVMTESNKKFDQSITTTVRETLSRVRVHEVLKLVTALYKEGDIIPDSESRAAFYHQIREVQNSKHVTIYLVKGTRRESSEHLALMGIARALSEVLSLHCNHLQLQPLLRSILAVRSTPEEISRILDAHDIKQFNAGDSHSRKTAFPPPGTFIPVKFHCFLDNSFAEFEPGEYIGVCTYDPAVDDTRDSEAGGDAEDNSPVFIYARVTRRIETLGLTRAATWPGISERYEIDVGGERPVMQVSATQMYKFHRGKETPCGALVPFSSSSAAPPPTSPPEASGTPPRESEDLNTILRNIRQQLTAAFALSPAERKRVKMRLLLTWHPDKNPHRVTLANQVTQKILGYWERLSRGENILNDADEADDAGPSHHTPRQPEDDVFRAARSRGSSYRRHWDEYFGHNAGGRGWYSAGDGGRGPTFSSSSSSSSSRRRRFRGSGSWHSHVGRERNPQPGEARRWLRQALADLDTARAQLRLCQTEGSRSLNWVCLQCHHAAEKALKAAWYVKDAGSEALHSQVLEDIADDLEPQELRQWARQLQSTIGRLNRMLYPTSESAPRIPSDLYTHQQASTAVDLASKIVSLVTTQLTG